MRNIAAVVAEEEAPEAKTEENTETPTEQPTEQVAQTEQVENPTEAPAVETQQPTALDRVPKDEKGEPVYEQTDADTAWDAIVEQSGGDEQMAKTVADSMVADKEAAVKKAEKAKPKQGGSVREKIEAEKQRQQAIDNAKAELEHWQNIAATQQRRAQAEEMARAEQQRQAEEQRRQEVEAQQAEQARLAEEQRKSEMIEQTEKESVKNSATAEQKEKASKETVSPAEKRFDGTAVSSDATAKVQQKLDKRKESYGKRVQNNPRGFITDISADLGLKQHAASHYGTFTAKDGRPFTFRLSNHNTNAETFDKNGEQDGISIVISSKQNKGIRGRDANAHVTEFFYPKKSIETAEGKPLVSIIESIKDMLETGEYVDRTGLAVSDEVNAPKQTKSEAATETAPESIFETARKKAEEYEQNQQVAKPVAEKTTGTQPKTYPRQKLSQKERKAMESIADKLGYKVVWHDTMEENGHIDYAKKEIHLAEDANRPIDVIFGHETTHAIRRLSEADYGSLRDAVKRLMGEQWWNEQIERKRKAGYAEDKLDEEVTADAVGGVLHDQKMAEGLARELEGKPSIIAKIRETWQKIIDYLRQFGKKEDLQQAENSLAAFDAVVNSFKSAKDKAGDRTNSGIDYAKRDEEYLAAVERGDMETAQRMVNEAAEKAGYTTGSGYQGTSAFNGAAPYGNAWFLTKEERKEAWDNGEYDGDQTLGDYIHRGVDAMNLDFVALDPRHYRAADANRKEAIANVRNAIQKKSKTITMYRSVPANVKEGKFRNGDWITPSRGYAEENARIHGWGNAYNIIEEKVPVDEIWWDGNDIAEWGYGREEDYVNDKDFAYKNTRNNRKSLDAVTYDSHGNVIPLSQRFNSRKSDERYHRGEGAAPVSHNERVMRDAVDERLRRSGIEVIGSEEGQRVLDAANTAARESRSRKSEAARRRDEAFAAWDWAVGFVTGRTTQEARAARRANAAKFRAETKEIHDRVLSGNFDDVTLQLIDDYINKATPNNEYGRPLSKRLPPEVLRRVRKGERTSAVDVLFSRICESAVPKNERTRPEAKRRIEEKKKELLKGWAVATGNWHTSVADFTDNIEPIGRGTDSVVYQSNDGKSVIKVSAGKEHLKKFRPDIDAVILFNHIFRYNPYRIIGYGEVDGKFVKFLEQPFVDFSDSTPLSAEERVQYMKRMGFTPMNDERTAFSNGKFVVADLQGNNIVKDKSDNIRVIDADVKLHTKDIGGEWAYPDVETDTEAVIPDKVRFFRTKDGEAYGFTVDGKIYYDPRIATSETLVHEYAHLWASALRAGNAEEWRNVVGLMKGTSVWDEVKRLYPELKTDDEIADEVIAQYSGRRGAERLREEAKKIANGNGSVFEKAEAITALEKVKRALANFWKGVCDFLHIHFTTAEEVADRVMKDLLDGVDPRKFGKTDNGLRMQENEEIADIVAKAKADGTYMKAPNGKKSRLSARQWAQVRTKAFRNWFGDWEKAARIEKLRGSKPIEITGEEYKDKYELNRESAKAWIKDNLRGEYTIADTNEKVTVGRKGVNKVTSHSIGNEAHLKSLVAIPEMLNKSTFIAEEKAEKANAQYPAYRYYVVGLKIGGADYTAKLTIGVDENGNKFYDHALTQIEKGSLLDNIDALSTTSDTKETVNGFMSTVAEPNPSVAIGKDTKLLSLLQTNSSKVVDENGEPRVVYHQTNSKTLVNRKTGEKFDDLDWNEKSYWQTEATQEDFEDAWEERDFYAFDNRTHGRRSIEMPAFFFSPQYDEYHEYGDRTVEAFLNIKNPAINPKIEDAGMYEDAGEKAMQKLIDAGYDGFIREYDGVIEEINAFSPNQIKSATDNIGTFDSGNDDIRYQFVGERGAEAADRAEEVTTRLGNLSVAREMEEAKKDAKTIKMATGWERGADGKWRYEIPDGNGIENPKVETKSDDGELWFQTTLGDIYDSPMLYASYPRLKTLPVSIQKLPIGTRGIATGRGAISLDIDLFRKRKIRQDVQEEIERIENSPEYKEYSKFFSDDVRSSYKGRDADWLKDLKEVEQDFFGSEIGKKYSALKWDKGNTEEDFGLNDEGESVIVHEIQHTIQDIEGFAKGGNPQMFHEPTEQDRLFVNFDKLVRKRFGNADTETLYGILDGTTKEYRDFVESLGEDYEGILKAWRATKKYASPELFRELYDRDVKELNVPSAYDQYRSLAGEVEARNVQKRMGMTEVERRASLAAETEDISREDQIFLFGETKSSDEHKKSAQLNEAALKHLEPTDVEHAAKVLQKREKAKEALANVAKTYKNTTDSKGFISDLRNSLGLTRSNTGSGYGSFETTNGKVFTIRVSNHNINAANVGNEPVESIVIKTKRSPNRFYAEDGKFANEYVYFKEDIRKAPAGTLSAIAESISELLDTGEYRDKTGLAKDNHSGIVFREGESIFDYADRVAERQKDYAKREPNETKEIWDDSNLTLQERITAAMTKLAAKHQDDKTIRNDAAKAIGGNLASLRKAMAAQRKFDQSTVKRVTDLAQILIGSGHLSGLSAQEVKRLLSIAKGSVGKNEIDASVQKVMDIMIDNQLRNAENYLDALCRIKESRYTLFNIIQIMRI